MFRLCPHPLLFQGYRASDAVLVQRSLDSDLEQRLIPRVLELGSPDLSRRLEHLPTRPPLPGLTPHGFLGCHRRSSAHRRDLGNAGTIEVSQISGRSSFLWPRITPVLSAKSFVQSVV